MPVLRPLLNWSRIVLGFGLAVAFFLTLPAPAEAGSFGPAFSARYCNALPSSFPVSVPATDPDLAGTPSCSDPNPIPTNSALDITYDLSLSSGDYMFGASVPILGSADASVASGSSITNGAKVGGISVVSTLGLLNGPCATVQNTDFILYDSSTSLSPIISPQGGSGDPFSNFVTDSNSDSLADSDSPFVNSYPSIYVDYLDPDLDYPGGPTGPLASRIPLARYSGMTEVSGEWQIVSVLQFEEDVLAPFHGDPDNRTHPLGRVARAPSDAAVSLLVLNDPLVVSGGVSTISDFCSPLSVQLMLLGTATDSQTRALTPSTSGTRSFGAWTISERDADGDGLENALDTCPFANNTGSDSDLDGIDNACDLASTPGNPDVDGDGFANRQDNCPQIANAGEAQRDDENATQYVVTAPDGGPRHDLIGDICDPNPSTSDGAFGESYTMVPKCIGGTDSDGDGYCAAEDVDDSSASILGYSLNGGPDVDGVDPLPVWPGPAPAESGAVDCSNLIDDDGDTYADDGCPMGGDFFGANDEVYVGTDPLLRCNQTTTANDEADVWPADFDDNRTINIIDQLALKPVFNTTVPPTSPRFDISPSKTINILDVLAPKPVFNTSC